MQSPTPGQAQGLYGGSFSSAACPDGYFDTLVLDNDEIWTLYGVRSENRLVVYGLLHGQGLSNRGRFSATVTDSSPTATTATGTLSAEYDTGKSFNGLLTSQGQTLRFSGAAPTAGDPAYDHQQAARLSLIEGDWSATRLGGMSLTLTIGATRLGSGTDAKGCTFRGSLAPRNSGKNVHDVTVAYDTAASCGAFSGMAGAGTAVSGLDRSGRRQLVIALVSNDRRMGTAFVGER